VKFRLAVAAIVFIAAACRTMPPVPSAIDSAMASCVPASATLLAGLDLAHLRGSPFYSKLPPAAMLVIEPYRDAHSLLLASDGKSLLAIARGSFRQAPAGATLLASGLAIAGDPTSLAAATSQHRTGQSGAPDLLADAAAIAPGAQIWMVARGGVQLPFTGNAANLNRLLRNSEYAAVAMKLNSQIEIAATVVGRTPDAARQVEETLRAAITLAAAGEARQSGLVALLKSIQITRDSRTVHAGVSASPDALQKLLQ
jgi:hypothetical protein